MHEPVNQHVCSTFSLSPHPFYVVGVFRVSLSFHVLAPLDWSPGSEVGGGQDKAVKFL